MTITSLLNQIVSNMRASVPATATATAGRFAGDFSRFKFSGNEKNSREKEVLVSGAKEFIYRKAAMAGNDLLIPFSGTEPDARYLRNLPEGTTVQISETTPFFFEGGKKELNLLDTYTPAIMLLAPQDEQVEFSVTEGTIDSTFERLELLFCDYSDDQNTGSGNLAGPVRGFVNSYYEQKIREPLQKIINEFLRRLHDYESDGLRTEVSNISRVWQPYWGADGVFQVDGFDANLSGFIVTFDLKIFNSGCAVRPADNVGD